MRKAKLNKVILAIIFLILIFTAAFAGFRAFTSEGEHTHEYEEQEEVREQETQQVQEDSLHQEDKPESTKTEDHEH